jgi:hypothetical protein
MLLRMFQSVFQSICLSAWKVHKSPFSCVYIGEVQRDNTSDSHYLFALATLGGATKK